MTLNTVVLVHGAFSDGSVWRKVIPLLWKRGLEVTAVQIPLSSIQNDVAAVLRALERQDGPVLLVGHSYGGAVISAAGNHPKVKGLVYVAAAAPDAGQSIFDWWADYATAAISTEYVDCGDGYFVLTRKGVRDFLAQDLPLHEADLLYATQGPLSFAFSGEAASSPAWRTKPSWYLVASQDHTVPPALQQDSAERMGAEIVVLQTSHMPMLSQPEPVADFIANAAASFAR